MTALEALTLAKKHRISGSALHILLVVLREGSVMPSRIAEETGLSCASITGLADTLQRGGWAERVASRADRRSLYVVPTEKAYETFAAALE